MTARYWLLRFTPGGHSAPPFAVWAESAGRCGHRMRGDFHGRPDGADQTWWREYLDDTGSSGELSWVLANWHDWLTDLRDLSETERYRVLERAAVRHANIQVDGPFEAGDEDRMQTLLDHLHETRVMSPFEGRVGRMVYAGPSTDVRKLFRRPRVTFHSRQTSFEVDYAIEAQVPKGADEGSRVRTFVSDIYSSTAPTRLVKQLTLVRLVDASERLNDEIEALAPQVRAGDPSIRVAVFLNAEKLPDATPRRAGVNVIPTFAADAYRRFGSIWLV